MLTQEQIQSAGDYVYQHGRLLERKLFARFFEDGTVEGCIRALGAYQNPDGGFGNGIEPDLLCPDSSAIGAETALYVLDLVDHWDAALVDGLVDWIEASLDERGIIPHPPSNMVNFPHQTWWRNPDDDRVLALAGILAKLGLQRPGLFETVRGYYLTSDRAEEMSFYSYPEFIYLTYCGVGNAARERLSHMVAQLPEFLAIHCEQHPLFSRYWYLARASVDPGTLERDARRFVEALEEDGGIRSPYPELPWWRPIFTVDGLILLRKSGFL